MHLRYCTCNFTVLTWKECEAYLLDFGHNKQIIEQEKMPLLPLQTSSEFYSAVYQQSPAGACKG